MAENKEYYTQKVENGSIQISEDVVASVAAMAVMEQEGVCGLSTGIGSDIAEMLGKPLHLEVWVRVRRGWSDDVKALKTLGYE